MKTDKDIVYVCGHRHPDTDSIASAIAYADLKNKLGTKAVACRLGDLNDETDYVLEKLGFAHPVLLKDARATLDEIEMDEAVSIHIETCKVCCHHFTYGWRKEQITRRVHRSMCGSNDCAIMGFR